MKTKIKFWINPIILGLFSFLIVNSCTKEDNTTLDKPFKVTDIDGNVYNTVTIGTQVWMVENLKTTKYRNGDPISNITSDTIWGTSLIGAFAEYNNNIQNRNKYGLLYNLFTVVDTRFIAPQGWHIPSQAEWETLINYLGTQAGGKMKEVGTQHWTAPNTGATNSSGLTILPAGGRFDDGSFVQIDSTAGLWSSTTKLGSENEPELHGTYFLLFYNSEDIIKSVNGRGFTGFSVRCIKD